MKKMIFKPNFFKINMGAIFKIIVSIIFVYLVDFTGMDQEYTNKLYFFITIIMPILLISAIWQFLITRKIKIVLDEEKMIITELIWQYKQKKSFFVSLFYPYSPYKGSKSTGIVETFTLKYEDIKQYGFIFDLNKNMTGANKNDIGFVTLKRNYYINITNFKRKDLVNVIKFIYNKTNLEPKGSLKDVI